MSEGIVVMHRTSSSAIRSASAEVRDTAETQDDPAGAAPAAGRSVSNTTTTLRAGDRRAPSGPDEPLTPAPSGRYEVRTTLAEGGMGAVRLCRDRAIGREVAMKVIRDVRAGQRARFVREARVQARLEHPAIVPVYEVGVDAEGEAFFTMKCVRGETLESVIELLRCSSPSSARGASRHKLLAAFVQVCLAVDYAHEHGVLHRDLKPANVMLGGHGEVYVLDWGIAKLKEQGDEGLTAAGNVLGTPAYMAPEQACGLPIDARADVWSLGALLFEILALESLRHASTKEKLFASILEPIDARPSVRRPDLGIPPELDAICSHACAFDRDERFVSARALANAVEAFLGGDRDHELRLKLAHDHLEKARRTKDRRAALAETGRAVALAPEDPETLEALVQLLSEPDANPPKEVLEAVERDQVDSQRRMMPAIARSFAIPWLVLLPFEILLGVRSYPMLIGLTLLWVGAAVVTLAVHRYTRGPKIIPFIAISAAIAQACTTGVHGMLVVPALSAITAMACGLDPQPRARRIGLFAVALGVLLPTILAWLDLHPIHYVFTGDTITMQGAVLAFPRNGTFAFLAVMQLIAVVVGWRFTSLFQEKVRALELRAHHRAWQLRHLVPAAAERNASAIEP